MRTLRPFVRLALFLSCVAVALFVVLGAWQVRDTYAGAASTASATPGTCHSFATVEEYYNASDVSPPVPCDRPHQSEVYAVHTYAGALAAQPQRPGLEALVKAGNGLCMATELRTYLGARERDDVYGLQSVLRWPTPAEWAQGERAYRCELMGTRPQGGGPPTVDRSLRNALAQPGSAPVRHCFDGTPGAAAQDVSCAQPHTAEYVNAHLAAPPADASGGADLTDWAQQACAPFVREYTGGRSDVGIGAVRVQNAPNSAGACLAVPSGGGTTTGTLAPERAP